MAFQATPRGIYSQGSMATVETADPRGKHQLDMIQLSTVGLNQFCKEKCNIVTTTGCVSKVGDPDELYLHQWLQGVQLENGMLGAFIVFKAERPKKMLLIKDLFWRKLETLQVGTKYGRLRCQSPVRAPKQLMENALPKPCD